MNRLIQNEMLKQERIKQLEQQIKAYAEDKRNKAYKDLKKELKALKTANSDLTPQSPPQETPDIKSHFKYPTYITPTKEEKEYLKNFFSVEKNKITASEQRKLLNIFNKTFNQRKTQTKCSPCVRPLINELKKLNNLLND